MTKPNEDAQIPPSPCFALPPSPCFALPPSPCFALSPSNQSIDPYDNSSYRIPPSVFSRNKSSNPGEWSSLSNESLFSIHLDTTSFTRDHVSGDLGVVGEPAAASGVVGEPAAASGVAAETVNNGGRLTKETLMAINEKEHKTRQSRESGTSTTSFAFPVLGELGKDGSTKIKNQVIVEQEKKVAEDILNKDSKPLSNAPSRTDSKTLSNTPSRADSKTLSKAPSKVEASTNADSNTATTNPNQSSWFSCFPCCRPAS